MRVRQFTLFGLSLASSTAMASWDVNLPVGVTPVSHDIYDLHMTIFWICVAIGLIVFGVMFYAILYHRKSQGAKAAHFHEHLWLEITWTVIPFIILIFMAIPAIKVLTHIRDTHESDLTIKITGHQWKWEYEYLNRGIHFFSNNITPYTQIHNLAPKDDNYLRAVDHPLVIPIHRKIRFLVTSDDVIHSWWVPEFGLKQDAIPGFIVEAWTRVNRPGIYHGQCAELCGTNHAFMPIVVIAMAEKDFDNWVAKQNGGTEGIQTSTGNEAPAAAKSGNVVPTTKSAVSAATTGPATANPAAPVATTAPSTANPVAPATTTAPATTNPTAPAATTAPATANPAAPAATTAPATANPTAPAATTAPATANPAAPAATTTPATTPTPPRLTLAEQIQKGKTIFLDICAACHQPNGEGLPPTYPALKGSPIATGPLPKHLNRVLFGKPGTAMQAFKDQFSDEELAAVITYERNVLNKVGDVVQPSDVKAARDRGPLPE